MVMKRVDTVNGDGSEQAGETREVESLLCWEARHLEDAPTVRSTWCVVSFPPPPLLNLRRSRRPARIENVPGAELNGEPSSCGANYSVSGVSNELAPIYVLCDGLNKHGSER